MRIWSIHPKYLDQKGLNAVWRETLLAKKVLKKQTKGYKNHPQLIRFKKTRTPLLFINTYLSYIWKEAKKREYNFDNKKIGKCTSKNIIISSGQLEYEFKHLKKKLKLRCPTKFNDLKTISKIEPHPIFKVKKGEIEHWEKI